jgi:hypothetical protein
MAAAEGVLGEARDQLGCLVTELNGVTTVLRTNIAGVDPNNVYSAVAAWVDRIALTLGTWVPAVSGDGGRAMSPRRADRKLIKRERSRFIPSTPCTAHRADKEMP